jgi:hypothetical protein
MQRAQTCSLPVDRKIKKNIPAVQLEHRTKDAEHNSFIMSLFKYELPIRKVYFMK